MKRDELIKVIETNCKGSLLNAITILDAVDRYSATPIAQSRCSTLRAAIEEKLNIVNAARLRAETQFEHVEIDTMETVYKGILQMIDDLFPPVA